MKECLNVLRQVKSEQKEGYDDEDDGGYEAEFYDAVSGEILDSDLVREGRKIEMETFKKHGVYEKRPVSRKRVRDQLGSSGLIQTREIERAQSTGVG